MWSTGGQLSTFLFVGGDALVNPGSIAEACQTSEDYSTGLREGTCLERAQGAG